MKKSLKYFVMFLSLFGCIGLKSSLSYISQLSINDIIYINQKNEKIIISDKNEIAQIKDIIITARRKAIKFIIKETIIFEGNENLIIKKDKQFLNINGLTYELSDKQNKNLDEILTKTTH